VRSASHPVECLADPSRVERSSKRINRKAPSKKGKNEAEKAREKEGVTVISRGTSRLSSQKCQNQEDQQSGLTATLLLRWVAPGCPKLVPREGQEGGRRKRKGGSGKEKRVKQGFDSLLIEKEWERVEKKNNNLNRSDELSGEVSEI